MTNNYLRYTLLIMLTIGSLWIISCDANDDGAESDPCNPVGVAGGIISSEAFGSYDPEQVQTYLRLFGAPPGLAPEFAVDAIRIVYKSRDKHGELVSASGVLFVPTGIDTLALLSVQHGTEFKRDQVGSANPLYAFDGLISAMAGYMVFEPDYLGLGSSEGIHPYLHAELSANAVIDALRAARIYACQEGLILSDKLFMAGYSEGGFATMAAHRAIEKDYSEEFQLTAVAPMAGPYDLLATTRNILNRQAYSNPAYMAYIVTAYNDVYGWDRIDDIFREPYASRIPLLLNGDYAGDDINDSLTTSIRSLFAEQFLTDFFAAGEVDIKNALVENSLLDWGPIAPVKLYHGTSDSTVYFQNSLTVFDSLTSNGARDVELIPLPGANHGTGAFPAYYLALTWFDSLKSGN
ncbi:MAG: lipase family protein [Candidatus Marinimicrobia bacterium]|nr:lipase family protein [Candidatus Neomarinimicrobiota bacterium]MCF7851119.1 lipase family protein [Candidatus Neomarinimicrobiota bacterium]MCF7904333.1 lipase family protein [Candidatus Neomarinimicrobiota bacterium]